MSTRLERQQFQQGKGTVDGIPYKRYGTINYGLLMRRILAQLELVAHGPTTQFDQIKRTKPGSRNLWVDGQPRMKGAHERFAKRFKSARSIPAQRAVIADALAALRHARYSRRPTVDLQTRDGRLMVGRDKRPLSVVASQYGYSEQHVRKLRQEAAREDALLAAEAERRRYDGTLEMRCRIAAEFGSAYLVAARWENVSARSVQTWRADERVRAQLAESLVDEAA